MYVCVLYREVRHVAYAACSAQDARVTYPLLRWVPQRAGDRVDVRLGSAERVYGSTEHPPKQSAPSASPTGSTLWPVHSIWSLLALSHGHAWPVYRPAHRRSPPRSTSSHSDWPCRACLNAAAHPTTTPSACSPAAPPVKQRSRRAEPLRTGSGHGTLLPQRSSCHGRIHADR